MIIKRIFIILPLVVGFTLLSMDSGYSQYKERKLKRNIKSNAVKEARKEAKSFKKQGYFVAPGALPMEKQIEKSWMRQYEQDKAGYPLYIVVSGNAIAGTQSAAKLQATELAKQELAGNISTRVAALVENQVSNDQYSEEEANTLTKTLSSSQNIIAQELGRVLPLFEIYRKKGSNIESTVRIAYNSRTADDIAKKALRRELEKETNITKQKLEKLMNFDNN